MLIKVKTSVAGLNFSYQAEQIVEAEEQLAQDLIAAGHAELVKSEVEAEIVEPPENAALITAKTKAKKRQAVR